MSDAAVNALGVFVLVTAGVVVAGAVMGQLESALALGPLVGATFGTATFLLFRRG